jgi:hypothetical protein
MRSVEGASMPAAASTSRTTMARSALCAANVPDHAPETRNATAADAQLLALVRLGAAHARNQARAGIPGSIP